MRHIDADELKKDLSRFYDGEVTAKQLIDEQPTVYSWISVKDRLPGIDEDVLILYESKVLHDTGYAITCLKDSIYFAGKRIQYQTPQWCQPWQYFGENNVVTHWMPLPEPPKEVTPWKE